MSELILYQTEDGGAEVRLRAEEGELAKDTTFKEFLTVQTEGKHRVKRRTLTYNLDMILAIGYRVRLLANTINPILLTRRCRYG
jgi:hypothetical protein